MQARVRVITMAMVLAMASFFATSTASAAQPVPPPDGVHIAGLCNYSGSHPTIGYGSRGGAVAHAQCLLRNVWDFDIVVDGQFGNNTKEAVEDHQNNCDIDVDGIVGPDTWRNLHPDTANSAC